MIRDLVAFAAALAGLVGFWWKLDERLKRKGRDRER